MRYKNDFNRESAITILNSLAVRHDSDGKAYRDSSTALTEDPETADFFRSLAHYRNELREEVTRIIEDMPNIPMTASTSSRSLYKRKSAEFDEALRMRSATGLLDLCNQVEEDLSRYYADSLQVDNLPEDVRALLERQHEQVLLMHERIGQMVTMPMRRDNNFK